MWILSSTWLHFGPREGANEPRLSSLFLILGHLGPQGPPGPQNYRFLIDLGSIFDRFLIDFLIDSSDVIAVADRDKEIGHGGGGAEGKWISGTSWRKSANLLSDALRGHRYPLPTCKN